MKATELTLTKKARKLIKLEKGKDEVTIKDINTLEGSCEYFIKQNCNHHMNYELDELVDNNVTYKLSICLECKTVKIFAFDGNNNDKLTNYLNNTIICKKEFIQKDAMYSIVTYEHEKAIRELEFKKICAGEAIDKCESHKTFKLEFEKRFSESK